MRPAVLLLGLLICGCGNTDGLHERFSAERDLWRSHRESQRLAIKPELFGETAQAELATRYEALGAKVSEEAPPGSSGPRAQARPIGARAWLSAAGVHGVLGDSASARRCFQRVQNDYADLTAPAAEAAMGEALIEESAENWLRAADLFDRVVRDVSPKLDGRGPETNVVQLPLRSARLRARAAGTPGRPAYETAIRYYHELLATGPAVPLALEAHLMLADAHGDLGEWDAAVRELQTAEGLAAADATLRRAPAELRLATALAQHRADPQSGAADSTLRALVAEYPKTATAVQALLVLGNNAFAAGDVDEALETYARIRSEYTSPDDTRAEAMLREARILESKNRWPEARELLRSIPREHPLSVAALEAPLEEARHYQELGDDAGMRAALTDAEAGYRSLMERYPNAAIIVMAQDKLTQVLLRQERYADAVDQLETVATRLKGRREGAVALVRAAQIALQELADTTRTARILDAAATWYEGTDIGRQARDEAARLRGVTP